MAEEVKHLETRAAERPVWLMKCPTVVSRAWQEAAAAATSNQETGGASPNPNPVVAKVVLSLDPLRDEQPTKASLLPSPLFTSCSLGVDICSGLICMVMPNCCWDGIGEFSPLSYLDVMGRFSGLIDGALENYDDFKLSDLYMISEWHVLK